MSIKASPFITIPSRGTLSPGLTRIISPIFTSSGDLDTISAPILTFAISGFKSIKFFIDFLDFSSAYSSNISPIWKNNITAIASEYFSIAKAPIVDMLIRNFSLKNSSFLIFFMTSKKTL